MPDDFLQSLNHLALGTRLKRAGIALQAATQQWLQAQGCSIPATHMPVIAALYRHGSLSTGALAQMLGIAQPGVSRMVEQLVADGWLVSETDTGDRRVRAIRLSTAGRTFAAEADRTLWPAIDAAVARLCADLSGSFLAQLTGFEDQLNGDALARSFHLATAVVEESTK